MVFPRRNSRHTREDSRQSRRVMICIWCITADNSSRGANKPALMSRGREQCLVWVAVHSLSPSRLSFKHALSFQDNSSDSVVSTYRHQASHLSVPCALLCRATAALIHFLTGRFTSLHPVQLPSSRLHTCDCRGSLSQLHTPCNSLQRGERSRGRRERTGWNIFQGSRHFLSDQPGAVGLQIKSVPKKKGRQQNTDRSCAFQPPPGKVPSSGKAGNFPWPTYSLSRVFISLRTLLWDL